MATFFFNKLFLCDGFFCFLAKKQTNKSLFSSGKDYIVINTNLQRRHNIDAI